MTQTIDNMTSEQFLDYPKMPETKGIFMVVVSVLIMSFGAFVPVLPILAFYALWLFNINYKGTFILKPSISLIPIGLLGLLCLFSVFWSDFPKVTLYYGLEFFSMLVCVVIASRVISAESFIKGIIIGLAAVLLVTILSGRYLFDGAIGKSALVGFFGQKNTVGAIAALCLVFSLLFFFYAKSWKEKILILLGPIVLACVCLYLSLSTTSVISVLGVIIVVSFVYFITLFPKGLRLLILFLMAFAGLSFVLLIMGLDLDVVGTVLKALGKSPTLTGRTDLWEFGIKHALENPLLGYGYKGFWVPGHHLSDYYMDLYKARSNVFHFHNLYVEFFVELGVWGLSLIVFIMLLAFIKSLSLILRYGPIMPAVLSLGMVSIYCIRSLAEVELLGPFGIKSFIFYVFLQQLLEFKKCSSA